MESLSDKRNQLISEIRFINNRPLFRYVEFNLANFCNRNCLFCPTAYSKEEKNFINNDIFYKALNELEESNFDGLIIFSGFSEPFLNENIYSYIKDVKLKIPNSTLLINTNGDFLDKDKIKNIFDLGLDYLAISIYDDINRFKYFEDINEELYLNIYLKNRYEGFNKNNRGGTFKSSKALPLSFGCFYPFYFIYIDWNGDLLFCCHNFSKENNIGNLNNTKLLDAWQSDKLNRIRKKMLEGRRQHIPCNLCDIAGQKEGKIYFEKWGKILNVREYKQ